MYLAFQNYNSTIFKYLILWRKMRRQIIRVFTTCNLVMNWSYQNLLPNREKNVNVDVNNILHFRLFADEC